MTLLNARDYQPVELSSVMFRALATKNAPDLQINPQIKTRIIEPGEEKIWARTSAGGRATEAKGLTGSGSQRNAEKNGFRVAYTRTKWQLKN